jgi:hypothetical protein
MGFAVDTPRGRMMRSLRTNKKAGLLALAALLLQIAVSFGHVHIAGIAPARVVGASSPALVAATSLPAQCPTGDHDEYCPICASIFLIASASIPQPPQLPVWFASRPVKHGETAVVAVLAPWRAFFQSRAPPAT